MNQNCFIRRMHQNCVFARLPLLRTRKVPSWNYHHLEAGHLPMKPQAMSGPLTWKLIYYLWNNNVIHKKMRSGHSPKLDLDMQSLMKTWFPTFWFSLTFFPPSDFPPHFSHLLIFPTFFPPQGPIIQCTHLNWAHCTSGSSCQQSREFGGRYGSQQNLGPI